MKNFKFFDDNIDDEEDLFVPIPDDCATWMWEIEMMQFNSPPIGYRWVLSETYVHGILEFLEGFPAGYIVPIHSITGNGIRHYNHGTGWGFDIRNEYLWIEYYNLVPNNDEV